MITDIVESQIELLCCAACGAAEADHVKLKKCTACYLARYCSVQCQRDDWQQHKRACKKRAARLRDEILFKQPESSYLGDCPICFLPLSLDSKAIMWSCCCKRICNGCNYSNMTREMEGSLKHTCAFCRLSFPTSQEEIELNIMKRVEVNDPGATQEKGWRLYNERDYKGAFEYYAKAAKLGDAEAHCNLACMYREGVGVEKDVKKGVYHLEEAAIKGHPKARNDLGCIEEGNGRMDRAIKHWVIAANLGLDASLEALKNCYRAGFVGKEDLAAALRRHQAAVDATKSPQRKAATEFGMFEGV
jgi:hypothetical protein|eukprot:scaffold4419_cov147-Skeletonema_marinoi.AAC.2